MCFAFLGIVHHSSGIPLECETIVGKGVRKVLIIASYHRSMMPCLNFWFPHGLCRNIESVNCAAHPKGKGFDYDAAQYSQQLGVHRAVCILNEALIEINSRRFNMHRLMRTTGAQVNRSSRAYGNDLSSLSEAPHPSTALHVVGPLEVRRRGHLIQSTRRVKLENAKFVFVARDVTQNLHA